jgi:hypothetical protein
MSGSTLPNAAAAKIADAKVRDFILNAAHPDNKGRAVFFVGFGFAQQQCEILRDALLAHPLSNAVFRATTTGFGARYRVRCNVTSPDTRDPCIDTVWVIDQGSTVPTFITAYPAPRSVRRAATPTRPAKSP